MQQVNISVASFSLLIFHSPEVIETSSSHTHTHPLHIHIAMQAHFPEPKLVSNTLFSQEK